MAISQAGGIVQDCEWMIHDRDLACANCHQARAACIRSRVSPKHNSDTNPSSRNTSFAVMFRCEMFVHYIKQAEVYLWTCDQIQSEEECAPTFALLNSNSRLDVSPESLP
jgi:hypothetical protein